MSGAAVHTSYSRAITSLTLVCCPGFMMIAPCVKTPKFALPPAGAVAWPSNEVTKDEAYEYNQILRCCIEDGYTLMTGKPRRSVKRASERHATATPVTVRPSEGAAVANTRSTVTSSSSVGAPVEAGAVVQSATTTGTATSTRSVTSSSSTTSAAATTTRARSPTLLVESAGAAASASGHAVDVTSTTSGRTSHHYSAIGKHVPALNTRDPGVANADVRQAKTAKSSHADDAPRQSTAHRSSPHASITQPNYAPPHGSIGMLSASTSTFASRLVVKHQSASTSAQFSAARQSDSRASHAGKAPLSASAKAKAKMTSNAATGKKRSSGNKLMIKREPGF